MSCSGNRITREVAPPQQKAKVNPHQSSIRPVCSAVARDACALQHQRQNVLSKVICLSNVIYACLPPVVPQSGQGHGPGDGRVRRTEDGRRRPLRRRHGPHRRADRQVDLGGTFRSYFFFYLLPSITLLDKPPALDGVPAQHKLVQCQRWASMSLEQYNADAPIQFNVFVC